jgi:AbiV family abortive infection protein
MKTLTADDLLMGTFLSAEQAWQMLCDASLLHAHRRFANAFVLSVACIEEVGLSRVRLELAELALQGDTLYENEVERQKRSYHEVKLRRGYTSPILVTAWVDPAVVNEKDQLPKELWKAEKRRPDATHASRTKAQYVDFKSSSWNRPADTDPDAAEQMLENAAAEYSLQRNKLMRKIEEPPLQGVALRICLPMLPDPSSAVFTPDQCEDERCKDFRGLS